jgi:curli biogenesis system outer membrane secretion channel CsgG
MGGWRILVGIAAGIALLLGSVRPSQAQLIPPKATVTTPEGKSIEEAQQEAYDGPKARIAVSRFTDKTGKGWWTGAIGDGMADMVATALFHTNRYIVLERQTLGDVLKEQDLGASGRIKRGTEAPVGEIEGAELLITGAVTEFEGAASGVGGGIGGFGGVGRILGGIAGGIKNAHMAIDVRVIDTKTSRIVAATSVEGEATDFNLGVALGGAVGGGALGGALGGWSKTPTEKALRICIQEAVKFVASKTPQTYYHYKPAGAAVATAPAPGVPPPPPPAGGAPAGAPAVATALPADATGTLQALKVIQTVRADLDKDLLADLNEVRQRGSIVSVVVTLRFVGNRKESEYFAVDKAKSGVLNYDSGESAPAINLDGFYNGRMKPGEVKTLRATFKAPKDAKKVGITLSGLGTFEDVLITQ